MIPLSQPLPRITKKAGDSGERSESGGSVTQGGTRSSCLALALGYPLRPFQGQQ